MELARSTTTNSATRLTPWIGTRKTIETRETAQHRLVAVVCSDCACPQELKFRPDQFIPRNHVLEGTLKR